jgi:hypothetical protein
MRLSPPTAWCSRRRPGAPFLRGLGTGGRTTAMCSVSFRSGWGSSPAAVRRHVTMQGGRFRPVGGARRSDLAAQRSDLAEVGVCACSCGGCAWDVGGGVVGGA